MCWNGNLYWAPCSSGGIYSLYTGFIFEFPITNTFVYFDSESCVALHCEKTQMLWTWKGWGCQKKPGGEWEAKALLDFSRCVLSEYRHKNGCPEWKPTHRKGTQSRERAWWGWTRMGGVKLCFFWNALREDVRRELWIHWDWGIKSGVMKGIFLEICI